jgi:arginyl-tRNA--protein-N-Asp/Glu arginylyltransferase
MTIEIAPELKSIRLRLTEPQACSYLDDRIATTGFVDPNIAVDNQLYGRLSAMGFRRSGNHLYTPLCGGCNACVSARIPVALFSPNRSQKRCSKGNADVAIRHTSSIDFDEHYPVYHEYICDRHENGDMYPPSREQFDQFLGSVRDCTTFLEFRVANRLIGCAVVDVLPNALSAIYTYFDPACSSRSLGTLAVLRQVALAQELGLKYLYLGYWIADCQKMRYKTNYRPLELLRENAWQIYE